MSAIFDWLVVVLAVIALVIVLLLRNSTEDAESTSARSPFEPDERPDPVADTDPPTVAATVKPVSTDVVAEAEAVAARAASVDIPVPAETAKPDDLKKVEGIGPKIASVLNAAGILTFAQLVDVSADHVREILEAEDPRLTRLADPTTWAEQAKLAAAGKWDELAALQDELKGGRRVN